MEGNADVRIAAAYHEETKHSQASIRTAFHQLDWPNKPHPFKRYENLPTHPLPVDFSSPDMATMEAISAGGDGSELSLSTLAQVLYFAAGITKKAQTPDGRTIHFRAAACAGALYPIEIYVVSAAIDGLPAGVYHFAPKDFALSRLQRGDFRAYLGETAAETEWSPTVALALTSIFWRSAWKYQARSYRYCFWDSGTILANLLATATSAGLDARVVGGFDDRQVDLLLGVDGAREGSLCLVPLGPSREPLPEPPKVRPLDLKTMPLSRSEVDYPAIQRVHRGSYLSDPSTVRDWKGALPRAAVKGGAPTSHLGKAEGGGAPLGETILRRGSTRHFRRSPIEGDQLGSILHFATRGFDADFLEGTETRLVDLYLLVNEVTGIPPGAYYYAGNRPQLMLLKEGEFRQWAGFLGLEQALPADASAVVFFLADLERVLGRFGNRGYRIAQLEAGILGGRMYLAAYALGLGATGLTFYDDEIVEFFSPHATGKDAIFMVALGRPVRIRSNVRRVPVPFTQPRS